MTAWLPVPDPLGILEDLTRESSLKLKDPLRQRASSPQDPNPVPVEPPPGYEEWRSKFAAGYGQYGLGISTEQVEREFESIPKDVLLYYFREAFLGPRSSQTLRLRQRASNPGEHNPVGAVNAELESLTEAKRREWEVQGYPPGLIQRALTLAQEWPLGMMASPLYVAVRGTPAEREVKINLHRMALNVAQRWIETMSHS